MGASTDAIIAYGFDLGEEPPESFTSDEEGGFDSDEFLLRDYDAGIPEWSPDAPPDYWQKRKEALAALPVEIIEHCSGEYPMFFLAVRGTSVIAHRGHPQEVQPHGFIAQEHIEALHAFCVKHGIDWEPPAWYIFSMWN